MRLDRRQLLKLSASAVSLASFGAPPVAAARELSGYDAVGLGELVRKKQITPTEVLEDTIRKIEATNPQLNAIVTKVYEQARQRAAGAASDGPFAGVPLIVKDNATIAGVTITRGSRALRANVAERTAPLFAALEKAGFNLVGVSNMPEMGLIDGTENMLFGPTRNPWKLEYSPGGSSGGSAAAVAAGMLPLAHGTDGGGSVRIPASHCGLVGLKASRGRLLPGNFATPRWSVLVDGALTRSVRDTALFMSVAEDPDTKLPKLGYVSRGAGKRLKIGIIYEGPKGQVPHPEVRSAIADTARLCRDLGHAVDEAKLSLDQSKLADAFLVFWGLNAANQVDAFAKARGITRLEDGFEPWALALREQARQNGPFDQQMAGIIPLFEAATASLERSFNDWDVLLTPVLRDPVFKIGRRDTTKIPFAELKQEVFDYLPYTPLHNVCGSTAISLPLSWDSNGLPIGSQFAARIGAEATLLQLAYELEEARPWAKRRPALYAT